MVWRRSVDLDHVHVILSASAARRLYVRASADDAGLVFTAYVAKQTRARILDLDHCDRRSTWIDRILHGHAAECIDVIQRPSHCFWWLCDFANSWTDGNRSFGEKNEDCQLGLDLASLAATRLALRLFSMVLSKVNGAVIDYRNCFGDRRSNAAESDSTLAHRSP